MTCIENRQTARRTAAGLSLSAGLAAICLGGAAQAASADLVVSGQIGLASENVGKGLGKSDGEPAVSGDIEAEFGAFHAGVSASTVRLSQGSDAEIVTTVGWAPEFAGLAFDFLVMDRRLPGTEAGVDAAFQEYQADVARRIGRLSARLRINWTPDGFAGTREAWWVELQGGIALDDATGASAALGQRRAHGGADYVAWNAGVKRTLTEDLALDVRWYDTDQHVLGERYERRLVGALTYAF